MTLRISEEAIPLFVVTIVRSCLRVNVFRLTDHLFFQRIPSRLHVLQCAFSSQCSVFAADSMFFPQKIRRNLAQMIENTWRYFANSFLVLLSSDHMEQARFAHADLLGGHRTS
jgi:hypothetical protein